MSRGTWFSVATAVAVIAFAVTTGMQWRRTQELRLAIELARDQRRDRALLLAERRRLTTRQASDSELTQLRADRTALTRLQSEVEQSKARTDQMERTLKSAAPAVALVPDSAWKNVGQASPAAAMESFFWAAQSDVATLANGIALDAPTQARLEALWQQLPAASRESYGSVARMIASSLAQDGAKIAFMGILGETQTAVDTVVVKARVENSAHQGKTENFEFRRIEDTWRLVIPPGALARYETVLQAQGTTPSGKSSGRQFAGRCLSCLSSVPEAARLFALKGNRTSAASRLPTSPT